MAASNVKALSPLKVIQKYQARKAERANNENVWQEIADYTLPRKNDFQRTATPGESKYVNLLDSTAMNSAELLAGTLHSLLTNPSGYFFNLSTGDTQLDNQDEVRHWIQKTVRIMHDSMNNSNFQTEVHEYYIDLVVFATAGMTVEEDAQDDVRFCSRALKELFIEENSQGKVDCTYRNYMLDARGIVEDFGEEGLPDKVLASYKASKTEKFEILHAVYPSNMVDRNYRGVMKFVSQYILVSEKQDLEVKGFLENPYLISRWSKASGEVYGRGCGEKALPEAKTVNKMTETTLKGAQKTVDPPLQAPDDGFVLPLITKPGGLNYYRSGSEDRITPIFADARVDFGYQAIDMKQKAIREAYYIDQLKLRDGPQMTATEVSERMEQALRFLAPMLGRQQSEFLQPLVERVYKILERKNKIPPVPAQLVKVPLKIQYSSVMAMSQRASELQNINRTMQSVAPFASSDPGVLDNFDGDQAIRYISKLLNFPQEMLRNAKDVASMREAKQKQLEAQQEQAQIQAGVDSAAKLASATAKVPQGAA